jgi:hypothetical protein
VVYTDREVWLVFEESPVTVVKVGADWARCIGAETAPTEHALLTAFDEAVRGRRRAVGLTVDDNTYGSVGMAMRALLQQHKTAHAHGASAAGQHVVLELHDSQDAALPVYSAGGGGAALPNGIDSVGSVIVALYVAHQFVTRKR